jgi:RNA polymerase sigma-70 factor, ECF subfamily
VKTAFAHTFQMTLPEDDARLLRRIAAHEMPALGLLYDRHHAAVRGFVGRCSRGDAEDTVQETFLTAARKAHSYDGRASCKPWLIGIAARLLQHERRSWARFSNAVERLFASEITVPDRDPQETALAREDTQRLQSALNALTPTRRVVLVMAEIEEMPCDEIARALDIPIGTVWTRLHHARKSLREILKTETP